MARILLLVASGFFLFAALGARFLAPAMGETGLKLFPWSYETTMAVLSRGDDSSRQLEIARRQLSWAPASSDPLVFGALSANEQEKGIDQLALVMEARRRSPRSDLAHAWLMQHYLLERELDKALESVGRLMRIRPEVRDQINQLLLALVDDDQGWQAIANAASGNPEWRISLLSVLLRRDDTRSERLIEKLLQPENAVDERTMSYKGSFVKRLVVRQSYSKAYANWKHFFDIGTDASAPLLYNGKFEDTGASAPFNWRLYTGPDGTVEFLDTGGIALRHTGRSEITVAEQMLLLPPSEYVLTFGIMSDGYGDQSQFGYQLRCDRQKTDLMSGTADDLSSTVKRVTARFVIPQEGCEAQWLRFVSPSKNRTVAANAQIRSAEINRAALQ